MKNILILILIILFTFSCKRNETVDLGSGYRMITSASLGDLTIVDEMNIVQIDGHIVEYTCDSNFIICAQKPRDSVPETHMNLSLKKTNEAFEKSNFIQFWIIDKGMNLIYDRKNRSYSNVYGPYTKEIYFNKREELGVPCNLKLNLENI